MVFFCNKRMKSPNCCQNRNHKKIKWVFASFTPVALETSVGFAALATGKTSNRMRVRIKGINNSYTFWEQNKSFKVTLNNVLYIMAH